MSRIALLGAGFSHNWGGWLAPEIMGGVLGHLANHPQVSAQVQEWPSFEDALSDAQERFKEDAADRPYLDVVQGAVAGTFADMNRAFAARPGLEFGNMRAHSITDFLNHFDAIFTLNQDLLLELHYNNELSDPRRWAGHYYPGLQVPAGWRNAVGPFLGDRLAMQWSPAGEREVQARLQPIYKLHGSANWRDGQGGTLMVLGGAKAHAIEEQAILRWYLEEFERYLLQPDTRIMVVGYGFRDQHIDDLLLRCWRRSQFRWFLVNPVGRQVLRRMTNRGFLIPNPLTDVPVVGESMRSFSTTFLNDMAELERVQRFFA